MASAGPAPGGKRSMDSEINLVPFIDLLSCCICFLLMTAVWTQVAKIDVKPAPNMPAEQQPEEPKVKIKVHLRSTGYFLSDGSSNLELPKEAEEYPVEKLDENLKKLRDAYPDVTAVTVMSDDKVQYKSLIAVMDLCLKQGLDDISVSGS